MSDIEDAILATYILMSEAQSPPPVTLYAALAHIEGLLLFFLQAKPTAIITQLQDLLKREETHRDS